MRSNLVLTSIALGLVAAATSTAQTQLTTVPVATGFASPLYAAPRPGDADSLFVVEQLSGLIRIVRNGSILPTPFINLRSRILTGSERGLLGLAFHPGYEQNGFFYVNYTRAGDGATIVERFGTSANPDVADPASGTIMLGPISQPYSNHNGGCLQFGPHGYLYVSTGDGGSGGDPGCRAQNGLSLLGKLLRIDVDSPTTRIPASNPFVGDPTFLDEIWAYGLRNPWRFSFDRETGDLWIADVGQNALEEVDFQPAASAGGENYGWKIMEGLSCYSTAACPASAPRCNDPSLVLPIQQYSHSFGCSITGGYVYRGCDVPDLRGAYFYADYCSGRIWTIRYDGQQVTEFIERTAELRPSSGSLRSITSFGQDARGELLIVASGSVWRVEARGPSPGRDLGFGTAGGNGLIPHFEVCGRLTAGAVGELRLSDAAASAPAALLIGAQNNPTPIAPFGTVVPYPFGPSVAATTDPDGVATFRLNGGGQSAVYYAQWVVLDAGGPGGVALSNALEVTFQ